LFTVPHKKHVYSPLKVLRHSKQRIIRNFGLIDARVSAPSLAIMRFEYLVVGVLSLLTPLSAAWSKEGMEEYQMAARVHDLVG